MAQPYSLVDGVGNDVRLGSLVRKQGPLGPALSACGLPGHCSCSRIRQGTALHETLVARVGVHDGCSSRNGGPIVACWTMLKCVRVLMRLVISSLTTKKASAGQTVRSLAFYSKPASGSVALISARFLPAARNGGPAPRLPLDSDPASPYARACRSFVQASDGALSDPDKENGPWDGGRLAPLFPPPIEAGSTPAFPRVEVRDRTACEVHDQLSGLPFQHLKMHLAILDLPDFEENRGFHLWLTYEIVILPSLEA